MKKQTSLQYDYAITLLSIKHEKHNLLNVNETCSAIKMVDKIQLLKYYFDYNYKI